MTDPDRVENDPAGSRYVLLRGDRVIGQAQYERADGVITFVHTEIDEEFQGGGLGSVLIRGALDDVRRSLPDRVAATCPYARRFLRDHPEYGDLTRR